ncbi:hypothetical protein AMTRI_Chr04g182900 [Amborella trichopoda]
MLNPYAREFRPAILKNQQPLLIHPPIPSLSSHYCSSFEKYEVFPSIRMQPPSMYNDCSFSFCNPLFFNPTFKSRVDGSNATSITPFQTDNTVRAQTQKFAWKTMNNGRIGSGIRGSDLLKKKISAFPGGSRNGFNGVKGMTWRPKVRSDEKFVGIVSDKFEFKEEEAQKTTVMIKNIPNKISRKMLLNMLDEHCMQMNERFEDEDCRSEYDFVYLPMDFKNKCNLGYAFVNLTSVKAAQRLNVSFHKRQWKLLSSRKICEISFAKIQGKSALEGHFRNSNFQCETDEFLPVIFSPPRDGVASLSFPTPLGIRRAPPSHCYE